MTKRNTNTNTNTVNANPVLEAYASATGMPVSPKVERVHGELAKIAASGQTFDKEIRTRIADDHGVPTKLVGIWAGLYGLTLATGRSAVATTESVRHALAELEMDGTESDAPERVAGHLGLKTAQAVTRILCESFDRPAGKRGRTATPLELDALHAGYLKMMLFFADHGASRPHNAALQNVSMMVLGNDSSVRINAEFGEAGLITFAGDNVKKDPSVLERVRAALAEYDAE